MQSVRLTFLQKIRWKNPRDRVGGGFRSLLLDHMGFSINMYNCNISIHVSLRRRTDFLASILLGTGISIHVSLRRRRTPGRDLIKARYTISTHISARERTPSFKCSLNALSVLQLTSPQGDEHKAVSLFISLLLFQLTSPRGDEPVFIGCIPFDIIISTRVSVRRRIVRIAMSA